MDPYRSFYQWIESHGGSLHPHVRIDVNEDQRGLFATNTIEYQSALITIPRSLIINRHHSDLMSLPTDDDHLAMLLFLLNEYQKKERSSWFPWIQLLQIDEQATEFMNERMKLFECVESSTLGQALMARYGQLQEQYSQMDLHETITLEVFCMIDHLIWSRVLELPDHQPVSLVPSIDFANHSLDPTARWFLDDEQKNIVLRAERSFAAGDEITISYGSKSNEELLYLYAFALPNNPNDRVTIPVSLSSDDPLAEEKLLLIQSLNLPARLTVNIDGHLNDESKVLAKILSAPSMDLVQDAHPCYSSYLLDLFKDYQNKLNSCSDQTVFVKYYLDGQKSILEKAMQHFPQALST